MVRHLACTGPTEAQDALRRSAAIQSLSHRSDLSDLYQNTRVSKAGTVNGILYGRQAVPPDGASFDGFVVMSLQPAPMTIPLLRHDRVRSDWGAGLM